jgi:hypothetical protein
VPDKVAVKAAVSPNPHQGCLCSVTVHVLCAGLYCSGFQTNKHALQFAAVCGLPNCSTSLVAHSPCCFLHATIFLNVCNTDTRDLVRGFATNTSAIPPCRDFLALSARTPNSRDSARLSEHVQWHPVFRPDHGVGCCFVSYRLSSYIWPVSFINRQT